MLCVNVFDKYRKIPILINGSNKKLKIIKTNKTKLIISNTCAFDSLFQLILAMATDNTHIKDYLKSEVAKNDIFKLVLYTMSIRDTTLKTYVLRARAIMKLKNIALVKNSLQHVDGEFNAAELYEKMFYDQPSIIKKSECCQGEIIASIPLVPDDLLLSDNFEWNAVEHITALAPTTCPKCSMWNTTKWNLVKIGPIVAIEASQTAGYVVLERIPKFIRNPKGSDRYKLVGCIAYESALTPTAMGHYKAVAFRNSLKWVIYDDMAEKAIEVNENYTVLLALVLFVKIK